MEGPIYKPVQPQVVSPAAEVKPQPVPKPMPMPQPQMQPEVSYEHIHITKTHLGKWVHCHSCYGMHEGILYKVMKKGIILTHHTQLASSDATLDITNDAHNGNIDDGDITNVYWPGPGMFLPYGGIYSIVPRPFPFFI